MKAIVCDAPFSLSLVERPAPVRGEGEVLVRVRRVGLCGTDYHIYAGRQPFLEYPRVIGHELAGEVAEAPEDSKLRVGQVVTINPYLPCGTCVACRRGKPNCCAAIRVLGVHVHGGMCDFVSVPAAAVLPVGDLSLDQAAMVEFLAIGRHAVQRGAVGAGQRVLVVGAGPIGVGVALFARLARAEVLLIDISAARLARASGLGIGEVLPVDDALDPALAGRTDGEFFDCVFDATGNIGAMCRGLEFVAHGGTYVLVSVVKEELRFPDPEFHKRETSLLASRNATRADFEEVIARIADGSIPTAKLHTQSLRAHEMPDLLPQLADTPHAVLKAIVAF
jgi:2-desacetyl-2-hydroxyethyl bacteriochlorophyllide A dehydrogenase